MIYKNTKRKKNDKEFKGQFKICMVFNVISAPSDLDNKCALASLRYAHVNQLVLNCCNLDPHSSCATSGKKDGAVPERKSDFPRFSKISKFIADSMDSLPTN